MRTPTVTNHSLRLRWVALLLLLASPCFAEDHLLAIGGGSQPTNTQVSLEKNILFFQNYLHGAGLDRLPHEMLFGDGFAGGRDVEFDDPNRPVPRANELLAEIFENNSLTTSFRPHAIPNLWGASNRNTLSKWFDTIGSKLKPDDRLIIYYTGHGGHAGKNGQGTTLALWNEKSLTVKEFNGLLDKLPPAVPVVLVMVQCYGGGFADFIYTDCDSSKGLCQRSRCGFFATLPDRPAAGCTPDIDEEDYKEYSTYFWAALAGHTRTGQPVASADYDGDGKVSFAEAHAYSLLNSDTVDISIKSTDVLLRRFSRLGAGGAAPSGGPLLSAGDDIDKLLAVAGPAESAVLKGLARTLNLEGHHPVMAAIQLANDLQGRQKAVADKVTKLQGAHRQLCRSLGRRLKGRWPELGGPRGGKVIADQGDAIVQFVEALPRYDELEKQETQLDDMEKQSLDLERTWVKAQRYVRTAENVALAANLPKVAPPDVLKRYQKMVELEAMVLGAKK